jgi:CubicO group peptidase (beta-lactamase class C family)
VQAVSQVLKIIAVRLHDIFKFKYSQMPEILATLLNNGISPTTGIQILEQQTVDQMFTNQIPHLPSFGRTPIPDSKPLLTNAVSELYPQDGDPEQGWGLTFMLTISPTATGRNSGAVHWSGISNCYWWCDRERGVAGIVCSQILPYGGMFEAITSVEVEIYTDVVIDPDMVGLWVEVETLVNEGLEASKEHSKISPHI